MRRRAAAIAWGTFALSLALKASAVVLVVLTPPEARSPDGFGFLVWAPGVVAFGAVGAVVASRRAENPVGWIFLSVGFAEPLFIFADGYARIGLIAAPGSLPAAEALVVLGWSISSSMLGAILLIIVLFPTGRLPSPAWRPLLAVIIGWIALAVGSSILAAGPVDPSLPIDNPAAAPGVIGALAAWVRSIVDPAGAVLVLAAAPAFVVRWRRAGSIERTQLKWFALSTSVLVIIVLVLLPLWQLLGTPGGVLDALFTALLVAVVASIPVSAGIAILRYRLYDIDLVIRRTLVYSGLVAVLGAVYLSLILGLQTVLAQATGGQTLPVALSTLAVAALFGPVRRRVRALVDRRFYRSRYDAQQTLEAFAGLLRDEVDADAVAAALRGVAQQAVAPRSVSLWLRREGAR